MALLPRRAQAGLERFAQEAEQWHRLGDATAFWRLVQQQYIMPRSLLFRERPAALPQTHRQVRPAAAKQTIRGPSGDGWGQAPVVA